jgi:hypothetical protein
MIDEFIARYSRCTFGADRAPGGSEFFAGLDLGQAEDFTALAVIERAEVKEAWSAANFGYEWRRVLRLRHMERMPLGTAYPDIVERVRKVMRSGALSMGPRSLAVDGTGVGRPVVDLLRRGEMGCRLLPVTITSGETERYVDGYYRVPKRDLIVGLQVLLQTERLQIAGDLKEGAVLLKEMAGMRVEVKLRNEEFEAWREGEHDDLVLAVALGCWVAGRG